MAASVAVWRHHNERLEGPMETPQSAYLLPPTPSEGNCSPRVCGCSRFGMRHRPDQCEGAAVWELDYLDEGGEG